MRTNFSWISRVAALLALSALGACKTIAPATEMEFSGSLDLSTSDDPYCRVNVTVTNPTAAPIKPVVIVQEAFTDDSIEHQGQMLMFDNLAPGASQTLQATSYGVNCERLARLVFTAKDDLVFAKSSLHELKFK